MSGAIGEPTAVRSPCGNPTTPAFEADACGLRANGAVTLEPYRFRAGSSRMLPSPPSTRNLALFACPRTFESSSPLSETTLLDRTKASGLSTKPRSSLTRPGASPPWARTARSPTTSASRGEARSSPPAVAPPAPTEIDYLRLIDTERTKELGQRINYGDPCRARTSRPRPST